MRVDKENAYMNKWIFIHWFGRRVKGSGLGFELLKIAWLNFTQMKLYPYFSSEEHFQPMQGVYRNMPGIFVFAGFQQADT